MSGRAAALERRLDEAARDERQRALRALLRRPLLAASGPHGEAYRLVRRHADWLRGWCGRFPSWTLTVDAEVARLHKTPPDPLDPTRPARDPRGDAFTRRRYVLLCLVLAALERSDRQTALARLAEQAGGLYAEDPGLAAAGVTFDLRQQGARRDLVFVVRTLLDLGVLSRVEGDEDGYVRGAGDALYSIHRPALAAVLSVRRGPSTVDAGDLEARLRAITAEPADGVDEAARTRRYRTRLYRALLDDPVLYFDELEPEERTYFDGQRRRLVEQVHDAAGLEPELRAEGLAMVDERGDLTDQAIPEEGTDGHVTLLLAEHLAVCRRERPGEVVGTAALEARTAELVVEHGRHWRKAAREPGAERGLCRAALDRLEAVRLIRRAPEGVVPLPAVARFAVEELA